MLDRSDYTVSTPEKKPLPANILTTPIQQTQISHCGKLIKFVMRIFIFVDTGN